MYSANSQQNWLLNDAGSIDEASVAAVAYLDAAVMFDNKPLEAGHVYCVSKILSLKMLRNFTLRLDLCDNTLLSNLYSPN